ncbi:hypothetical protein J2Y60_001461 [Arcicella sp. BE140]|nr:hypothetical protein [Arcicella sp. BE51]MDR6811272.1 hypothetical protein [Arcicella sp. BE140]MDR6822622.1 hypothetical protein [Arcicella sp. BE139]
MVLVRIRNKSQIKKKLKMGYFSVSKITDITLKKANFKDSLTLFFTIIFKIVTILRFS